MLIFPNIVSATGIIVGCYDNAMADEEGGGDDANERDSWLNFFLA